MDTIAFIGIGNLGLPMSANLVKAGYRVQAYDIFPAAREAAVAAGAAACSSAIEAVRGANAVITMVPSGKEVVDVLIGDGVIEAAEPGTLFMDCSTIDIETARRVKAAAAARGHEMVDAPVSGGSTRAAQADLTIMVGGTQRAFGRAEPILARMASSVQHLGDDGAGLTAKICNNLISGITLAAVAEAFVLAERLGLDGRKFFEVASRSSGQCWALTSMCPIPGPVPTSPANFGFKPGGASTMLLKDLGMAQDAAMRAGVPMPMGSAALSLYTMFCNSGRGHLDVSAIIQLYAEGVSKQAVKL
jgi:3-hydroxyisobutyrate dehydrogenase